MKRIEQAYQELSRRDRQVLDAVLDLREASAQQILTASRLDVSLSTIRTFLSRLEEQGFVTHRSVGKAYVYSPSRRVGRAMIDHLRRRLISLAGSPAEAVAMFLKSEARLLSADEIAYLRQLIDDAEQEERND
jgi:predicted transcriptional regulator